MKRPSFQFYPADWRKDPGVQSLSYHDRGVWFEILCLLHESEERGKLLLNGRPMPEDALARLLGLDKQRLNQTLTTLLEFGVAQRDEDSGAIMNRRMVRDEALSKIRAESGKKGGNPVLLNQTPKQNPTTQLNQNPTPSSSSSTSVEIVREKPRERCTIDQAVAFGNTIGMTKSACEIWWHTRNAAGWVKPTAGGGIQQIQNWQSDMAASKGWAERESSATDKARNNHRETKAAREYPEPDRQNRKIQRL